MPFPTLTIETGPKKKVTAKTRTFSVHLLGFLTADGLWEPGGDGSVRRPVWLAYFGTERESHPFTANLRGGKKARAEGDVLELAQRALYRWTSHKVPGGIVTVAYLPDLFHLEPEGPLPSEIRFVFAPPRWWIEQQADELADEFGEDAPDAARAALFCAYLDRRTPLPLVHDLRFHLRVYRAALDTDWIYSLCDDRGQVLRGRGAEASGLDAPLACSVEQPTLAAFLIDQTTCYYKEEILHGTPRIPSGGRVLPYPAAALAEHCLDSEVA
jgi:hypothetical protein